MQDKQLVPTLVADDDPDILNYFRAILKKAPNELHFATNGRDAVTLAQRHKIELAFLDIMMPVMSGLDALVELKKIRPQMQIIMISAYSDGNVVKEALRKGAYSYLFKPLNKMDILSVTMKCLKEHGIEPTMTLK